MLQLISFLSEFYKYPEKLNIDKLTHKSLSIQKTFNAYGIYRIDEMIALISEIHNKESDSEFYGITNLSKDIKDYLGKNRKKEELPSHSVVNYLKSIKFNHKSWQNQVEYNKIASVYRRYFKEFAMDAIQEVFSRYIAAHQNLDNMEPSYFMSQKVIYSIKRGQSSKAEKASKKNHQELLDCKYLMDKILYNNEASWIEEINSDVLFIKELTKEIFINLHDYNIAEDDFEDKIVDWAESMIKKLNLSGKPKLFFLLQIKFAPLVRKMPYDEWQDVVAAAALEHGISRRYFDKLRSRLKETKNRYGGDIGFQFIQRGIENELLDILMRVEKSCADNS